MNNILSNAQKILDAHDHWSWVLMAVVALIITLIIKVALSAVTVKIKSLIHKIHPQLQSFGEDLVSNLKPWVVFLIIFYFLTESLNPPKLVSKALFFSTVFAFIFQLGIWGLLLIRMWQYTVLNRKIMHDQSSAAALGLLYKSVQVVYITIIVLIGLSQLGVNITALVAGLGVGGIAVALAAQNILGDLLASLSIVLDKPFVIGDMVVVGNERGTIEQIGIKTTRIRSVSGEELIISNKDLLESRIRNFKRMTKRQGVQRFGVNYSVPPHVLEQIPTWIKAIVNNCQGLQFDRCHLVGYGSSSIEFELVFYSETPDYNLFLDAQQLVLVEIFKKFNQEGIQFATPAPTILMAKTT